MRACLQVCRHGVQSGTLARPYTHAGTSAYAPHADDIDSNLFQGLGFMVCVYLFLRNIAQRSGNRNRSIHRRGGARSRWGWVSSAIWYRECSLFVRQGGSARACLYCLPARHTSRHTGEAVHARRHARTRFARRRHRHRPVPGPGVHGLRVFVLPQRSARQRQHNAYCVGISPSLIQSWNDTHNDKVFAYSIFEIINCVHCRILDGLGWQVLTNWEANNCIIKPMPYNTDSVSNATQPSTISSPATVMINLFFSCVSIGASRALGGGFGGAAHRFLQQPARPSSRCLHYRILYG